MKRLSLLYCAAAMLLSACTNDPAEIPEAVTRAVVFEASNPADGSRTEIRDLKILWQSQDAVGLFSPQIADAKNRQIVVEEQYVGQSRAVLKSDLRYANNTDDHTFYAYYPYAEGQTDYTRIEGTIATQQDGTIRKSAFMWASKTVKPSDSPVGLQFQHPFTYIDIQVGTEGLYAGATVKEVRLKAADGKVLAGKFTANLTTGAVTFTEPANEVAASADLVLGKYYQHAGYMVVNAEDLTGTTVEVYVTVSIEGKDITLRTTKTGRPFKAQSKVQMLLNVGVMTDVGREDRERQALTAIYNALGGDNWTNNENWCSDRPLSDWSGVTVYSSGSSNAGSVYILNLSGVSGTLPAEVGELTNLTEITIDGLSGFSTALYNCSKLQNITFVMPNNCSWSYEGIGKLDELLNLTVYSEGSQTPLSAEIGQCTKLQTLEISGGDTLPKELGNLTELKWLWISDSNFSGELPDELGNCTSLIEMELCNNRFTGRIPESIVQMRNKDLWRYSWAYIVQGNDFDLSGTEIPAEKFNVTGIDGQTIDAAQIYASNEYTLLYQFVPGYPSDPQRVKSLYGNYKDKLGVIGYTSSLINGSTEASVRKFVSDNGIEWPTFLWNMNDGTNLILPKKDGWHYAAYYPYKHVPAYTLVDKNGKVVCYDFNGDLKPIVDFITQKLGEAPHYESTDYLQDGKVQTLQTATVDQGIDVVLMGDAFSDRQIADGTYMKAMRTMADNFFSEEPYKSFKDWFNVYVVNVVSKVEGYDYGEKITALQGYFGEGTFVGGNDDICFEYAQKAISEDRMNEALIIVAMNQDTYAGTCWMYYPDDNVRSTYGSGPSIAYFPISSHTETFAQLLHHEACGHGFAKLADEYAYESNGAIPEDEMKIRKKPQDNWGWYKNADFTSNPAEVRWSHFINDPRYANEGLGVYEGGFTYWSGVWRPTRNSIMRYNTGGFNAPSREAIYYRIHKLVYGDSWEYDYETFVEWDARNRAAAAVAARRAARKPANYRPTHPPVVVEKSWRDAK